MKKLFLLLFALNSSFLTLHAQWAGVGKGTDWEVLGLHTYGGNLIVGGNFDSAGGVSANAIAQWNGSTWSSLGKGMNTGESGTVIAFDNYAGNLIAGGQFDSAGGTQAYGIAQWNGSTWSPVGAGINKKDSDGIFAMVNYGGNMVAGGIFDSAGGARASFIAQWNGSAWSPLGSGMDGAVYGLCVYGSNLYAGGTFTHAGGVPALNIAMWNGSSWSAVGTGVSGGSNLFGIIGMIVYNSNLYVSGIFDSAGGKSVSNIAMWNGSSWSALGTGINIGNNGGVAGFAVYNNMLYVGGTFTSAGGLPESNIAAWDGTKWYKIWGGPFGITEMYTPPLIYSLAVYNGALYAGGLFDSAGSKFTPFIAAYTGVAGIKEIADSSTIRIYPNPCKDKLLVQKQGTGVIEMMCLYNTLGALVWQSRVPVTHLTVIPVNGLAHGIYFLKFELSDGSTLVKRVEVIK